MCFKGRFPEEKNAIILDFVQITSPLTMGEQWLLKQFSLNHPVEHIQKPKLPKLYVRVETSTSYFIIQRLEAEPSSGAFLNKTLFL